MVKLFHSVRALSGASAGAGGRCKVPATAGEWVVELVGAGFVRALARQFKEGGQWGFIQRCSGGLRKVSTVVPDSARPRLHRSSGVCTAQAGWKGLVDLHSPAQAVHTREQAQPDGGDRQVHRQ